MSATATNRSALDVVSEFFDAYRSQDVEAMVDLCSDNCDFDYVPVEVAGKQRTVRGDGKVRGVGKALWVTLIDSFPDLTNNVNSIVGNDDGDVLVEVTIGGNQAKAFGAVGPAGRRYDLPHLFVFHVGGDALIDSIRAYWDSCDWYSQLGWKEIG